MLLAVNFMLIVHVVIFSPFSLLTGLIHVVSMGVLDLCATFTYTA